MSTQLKIDDQENTAIISGNINTLDSRTAMGLPCDYEDLRFSEIGLYYSRLPLNQPNALVNIMRDIARPIEERYAAGQLLGITGDPRILTFTPNMIDIPAASVDIGLEPDQVDDIVKKYRSVGVLEEWIRKETPRFTATIKHFRLAKYPITHQEYRDFLLDNPCSEIPTSWKFGRYPTALSNHPVHTISEFTAEAYCQWLSEKTGRYFRLPTEIEWEYSAAGPSGHEFPWGNQYHENHANTAEFGLFDTTPVGLFSEGNSYFGVSDLAGNIEEYTADDYWAYPGGQFVMDDLVKQQHSYRIARGGSFTRFSDLARCRRRHGRYDKDIYVMGFRIAESVE